MDQRTTVKGINCSTHVAIMIDDIFGTELINEVIEVSSDNLSHALLYLQFLKMVINSGTLNILGWGLGKC